MTETTEATVVKAKAPAKPKRVYAILNEQGQLLNVLSDVANLELAIITTGEATEEGVNASIVRAAVEKKSAKKELDELTAMLDN